MGEESRCVGRLSVSMGAQRLLEAVIGKNARLGETIHAFAYFNKNVFIMDEGN